MFAIVGVALRLPGGVFGLEDLWGALSTGKDLVGQIDEARWPVDELLHPENAEPGRSLTFEAGVVPGIGEFDAGFFGISPREAAFMDPQQRLLLELSWEALEDAGIPASRLRGSRTGVFVGISGVDYGMRALDDLASIGPHFMTGNTLSIAANRLSYFFDLHGPSLSVDTACSSALVALHQACNSLRLGESEAVLVGGVNLLLHPYPFVGFSQARMLSPKGRCRAFDADGDGYVRAEGGAVLLIKPLEKALNDGDRVHAVILATGANADGRRKTGLTIPSSEAQAELMADVLARSGRSPNDIVYIEAHGTGTAVGDPVEAEAIGRVYGGARGDGPLPIGSIKTHIGHLEPASGLAGLLKSILVLRHQEIPPSLHLRRLNPDIPFSDLSIAPVTRPTPLDVDAGRPPVVGVNSFGFGGANAHVLLQTPPQVAPSQSPDLLPPLLLSARSETSLRELAGAYAQVIENEPSHYYDIAHAALHRREPLDQRLLAWGDSLEEVSRSLRCYADMGETDGHAVRVQAQTEEPRLAFVYAGNGAQWRGMGRALMQASPRFAACMERLDGLVRAHTDLSIVETLRTGGDEGLLDRTEAAQPLLFAIQVGITELLRDQGIEPDAVTGHSVGEVAAAWAAGRLDLETAVAVICKRSAAQGLARGSGRMAAVALSEADVRARLRDRFESIEIAGINSEGNCTVSGDEAEILAFAALMQEAHVFCKVLDLDYAFHSRAMDAIRAPLAEAFDGFSPEAGEDGDCTFVSTVTGTVCDDPLDGDYWWRNVRQPVRFEDATRALLESGCGLFLEIGPQPILRHYLNESLRASGRAGQVLATLQRDDDGLSAIEGAAARVLALCPRSRLAAHFPVRGAWVDLPPYPWDKQYFWMPRTREALGLFDRYRVHPLLGWRVTDPEPIWENVLDEQSCPWLADHQVDGAIVFPGAGYVELALAAAEQWLGDAESVDIEELDIVSPMVLEPGAARQIRVQIEPRDHSLRILSRPRLSEDEWQLHAVGRIPGVLPKVRLPQMDWRSRNDARRIGKAQHYLLTEAVSLGYGPAFQCLGEVELWQAERLLAGRLDLPESVRQTGAAHRLHPAVLDACFQALVDLFEADILAGRGQPFVPIKIDRLRMIGSGTAVSGFRMRVRHLGLRSLRADLALLDEAGEVVALLDGCRFKAVPLANQARTADYWVNRTRLQPLDSEQLTFDAPVMNDLAGAIREALGARRNADGKDLVVHEYLPLLEGLVLALLGQAMQRYQADDPARFERCCDDPRQLPAPSLAPLFQWAVDRLQEEKILGHQAGEWELNTTDIPPADAVWDLLLRGHPDSVSELAPLALLGERLSEALAGRLSPAELFAGLSDSMHFLTSACLAPVGAGLARAMREILLGLAGTLPAGRRLRVLEIGSDGDLARQVLEQDRDGRIDYVLAGRDIEAQEVSGEALSIGRWQAGPPGLVLPDEAPACFDLVLVRAAADLLHASEALDVLRARLAENGLMILAGRYPDDASTLVQLIQTAAGGGGAAEVSPQRATPALWHTWMAQAGLVDRAVVSQDAQVDLGSWLVLARNPEPPQWEAGHEKAAWVILQPDTRHAHALGMALADQLARRDQAVTLLPVEGDRLPDTQALARAGHIVFLAGLATDEAPDEDDAARLLALAQWLQAQQSGNRRLWVVTRGGALLPPEALPYVPNGEATLWGLGRVMANEMPEVPLALIDLDPGEAVEQAAERLARECLESDGADEVILARDGRRTVYLDRMAPAELRPDAHRDFRLDFLTPGQLRNLLWLPQEPAPLGHDQVEVAVVATGLNFRDVMYAMGMLPDEAVEQGFAGASLGLEFSGRVTRVGEGVSRFRPGDPVMGFGSACFSSHVVTREDALAAKPRGWSFEQAATVPTVFFTVYYALRHLARLQPGERVLIHGAAGGVGIAAIQLAKLIGAEIHATAGSDEKRAFVRLLGADHVYDSRSLGFADALLEVTDGQGVDVVLNSLAGEAIRRNLRVLKPFGRFLELGKRDFFENTPVGLRPFKDNISYFGIDADQLLVARPQLAGQLFEDLMQHFESGELYPLPYQAFEATRVVDAFRAMQQARHIGKIVVRMEGGRVPVQDTRPEQAALRLKQNASYLVTGGLSGFGLATARRLAERGAGELILVGRRGGQTPGAKQARAELEALGCRVTIQACDISDRQAVAAMLAAVRRDSLPLAGIVHAAMVLDDAFIARLDSGRLHSVLAPKAWGAWHLHELTRDLSLDHFILYSSITTYIGNPGQANYVAANAYLEALAAQRRAQGLPAVCIGWGPIGDAGYLTRNQAVKESLEGHLGAPALSASEALDALERVLDGRTGVLGVAGFSWPTLAHYLPASGAARFRVLRARFGEATHEDSGDFRRQIEGKSADEVSALVRQVIVGEIAEILGMPPERVEPARPLREMGLDSLMGAELVVALEQRVGIRLPMMLLTQSPSVEQIVQHLVAQLTGEGGDRQEPEQAGPAIDDIVDTLAEQHGADVNEEEVYRMLNEIKQESDPDKAGGRV